MIDGKTLEQATGRARDRFKKVKEKYDALKPYLVFSSPAGQAGIDSGPFQLLKDFPAMVADTEDKRRALSGMARLRELETRNASPKEVEKAEKDLDAILAKCVFHDHVNVEVRMGKLKYEHIWALQQDELIDRALTPQTKASIRIVLASLASLANGQEGSSSSV